MLKSVPDVHTHGISGARFHHLVELRDDVRVESLWRSRKAISMFGGSLELAQEERSSHLPMPGRGRFPHTLAVRCKSCPYLLLHRNRVCKSPSIAILVRLFSSGGLQKPVSPGRKRFLCSRHKT